jgi:hypothetical protein
MERAETNFTYLSSPKAMEPCYHQQRKNRALAAMDQMFKSSILR